MDYHSTFLDLKAKFPDFLIEENHPLAPYTTLKIGGPADIFIHTKNAFQFKSILKYLYDLRSTINDLPFTILGNGSNVLISDSGIRGIVIKNSSQKIAILESLSPLRSTIDDPPSISPHRTENEPEKYLDFTKIDYDESACPTVLVKLSSGTPLPFTINYLLSQGITGLQWFAYIPGTIGGAVWYNIHGGKYHFSQYVDKITVFDLSTSMVHHLRSNQLDWGYDQSFFQHHPNYVILTVTLRLYRGDTIRAKATASAWMAQKLKVQPMNSAGSVFKNPKLEDCLRNWGEQKSTGWIIDHELNLKGYRIGGAQISEKHANFIINAGSATAADFLALVKLIQSRTKEKFHFTLQPEVKFLGTNP